MELVFAVVLSLLSPTEWEYQSSSLMTINQCLEEARDFNDDPNHTYIIVCMPNLGEVQS